MISKIEEIQSVEIVDSQGMATSSKLVARLEVSTTEWRQAGISLQTISIIWLSAVLSVSMLISCSDTDSL